MINNINYYIKLHFGTNISLLHLNVIVHRGTIVPIYEHIAFTMSVFSFWLKLYTH